MPQPLTQQQNEEAQQPPQRAVGTDSPFLSFAIDPDSGHLFISGANTDIRLRDTGEGSLGPSDDTADAAGTIAKVGPRLIAYGAV